MIEFGKPSTIDPEELVTIGRLGKPHGLRGELTCQILTDFPERFEQTETVHILPVDPKHSAREVRLERAHLHHGRIRLKLQGVNTIEQAQTLRNCILAVPEDELVALDEGEFYHFELEGLDVIDEAGEPVGVLEEVLSLPAHEVYAVRTDKGQELLVPAVPDWVLEVDLDEGFVRIRVPHIE